MAENNEKVVEKKENIFKKIVNSNTTKKIVQIGTTFLAIADTAFLIWAYFDTKSDASVPAVPNEEATEMEVKPVPNEEVVNTQV